MHILQTGHSRALIPAPPCSTSFSILRSFRCHGITDVLQYLPFSAFCCISFKLKDLSHTGPGADWSKSRPYFLPSLGQLAISWVIVTRYRHSNAPRMQEIARFSPPFPCNAVQIYLVNFPWPRWCTFRRIDQRGPCRAKGLPDIAPFLIYSRSDQQATVKRGRCRKRCWIQAL